MSEPLHAGDIKEMFAANVTAGITWIERGLPVFPIAISWDDLKHKTNKRPLTGKGGFKHATTDRAVFNQLVYDGVTQLNDGEVLACATVPGAGGFVVFDGDVDNGKHGAEFLADELKLPPWTYTPATASGGVHRWYRKPDTATAIGNKSPWAGNGVDIRADNGYVVCPGTVTPWGTWTDPAEPGWGTFAQVPEKVWDQLGTPAAAPPTEVEPAEPAGFDVPVEVAEKVADLDADTIKDRSTRFHHLVGECRRAGLTQGQTVTVLTPWCAAVGKYVGRIETNVAASWARIKADELKVADYLESIEKPDAAPVTIDTARDVFRHWLGDNYDLDAMTAAVSVAVCIHLDGDTPWLLVVSGSGFTKTETVSALAGAGAHVTSTITSEGALLSATSKRERTKTATGGLLRSVGAAGVLVIKDVTSILSMGRELRSQVLAALREVADGYWERNVGTDGGQTLTWSGRCVTVGAVTTAWDKHHQVVAEMGDRFLLVRMDSDDAGNRDNAGRQALRTTSQEKPMRAALKEAVAGLIAGMDADRIADLTDHEENVLLGLADVAARCRTAVERDGHQKPEWAHALEAPTRLAKYLWQLIRGAVAIGVDRDDAVRLAARVAGDCMPPLRKRTLLDVRTHPGTTVAQTAGRLQLPWSTTDRAMQELHLLGAVEAQKDTDSKGWRYTCADVLDPTALDLMVNPENYEDPSPEKSVGPQPPIREKDEADDPAPQAYPPSDISGDDTAPRAAPANVVQDDDVIDVYDDPGQEELYRMLDDLHGMNPTIDGRGESIRATVERLDGTPAVCPDCGEPHGQAADVRCYKCFLADGGL